MSTQPTAQRDTSEVLGEYVKICEDKRRRYHMWLMLHYNRRQPEAVNHAMAAAAVEAGWDYK